MIIATIQSKQTGGSYPHITAVNGEILGSEAAQPYVDKLYELIEHVPSSLNVEEIIPLAEHFLCVQYHPEPDDKGRIRPALILWSSDEHIENLTPPLEAMGLDTTRFYALYEQHQANLQAKLRKATQARINRILAIAAVGVVAAGAFIYISK